MGRTVFLLCLCAAVTAAVGPSPKNAKYVVEPANLEEAPYADWAHGHWVWLSAERANQTSMLEYVQEYLDHNITITAADFDSAWSTGFNNFIFNSTKYPDPQSMVNELHGKNIRVIFWATSMIDTDSSNYQEGLSKGYYLKNFLNQPTPLKWWHGHGCLLDYTNPSAVEWWHNQMDAVLNLGIDGWKTDGTDPFMMEYVVAHGFNGTVSYREYADLYYGDFFDYTRSKLGKDRLIMSRPVDGFPPVYLGFSPRRVLFSGWVGDQDPTWDGLRQALLRYLQSGWSNYVGFGSDIGGYRSGKGPKPLGRTAELFIRWYQLGAFSSLMENGGDNEHRPWAFDAPGSTTIADNYKLFVDTHLSLVPYLLTTGADAYSNNCSILVPMAPHATVADQIKDLLTPATFQYLLGTDILVAPVMANSTVVNVTFTPDATVWAYWWNTAQKFSGNNTVTLNVPLTEFPVFSRVGAIIPMRISTDNLPYGASWLRDSLTIHLNFPRPSLKPVTRHIRQFNSSGLTVSYQTLPAVDEHENGRDLSLTVSATDQDVVFMISGVRLGKESAVQYCLMAQDYLGLSVVSTPEELMASEEGGAFFDDEKQLLYIRPFRPTFGVSVVLPNVAFSEL